MRGALRVGRLFGIDINLDPSWVFIFALMTWNLTAVFHRWHSAWALSSSFVLALAASLLFFASVLAHEFAHALVAQSFGMKVRQIRLFLFGGVSDIEQEPATPKIEISMAIAGPLLSLGLGVLLTGLAGMSLRETLVVETDPMAAIAALTPLQTVVFWLGPVNVGIGLFNLIPGFPLDGGRVLRGILWKLTGDLHRATQVATGLGRFVGLAFMIGGVAMAFGLDVPYFGTGASGLWLAFIGWFLRSAADRSFGAFRTEEMLEGVRVANLMRPHGTVLDPGMTLRAAVDAGFMRSSEHAFPVIDAKGQLVGLLCLADVRKVSPQAWDATLVASTMMPLEVLAVAEPNDELNAALRTFGKRDVEQLPVIDAGVLVGMLTRSDVARWLELNLGGPRPPLLPRPA